MDPLPWYRIVAPVVFVAGLAVFCAFRNIPRFRAMLLGTAVMVGYAMIQDQFSARLCPEYFTVFHNPIPGVTDPTLIGLSWGFLGAWWGGAAMGYAVGIAATYGSRPPVPVRALVRPMLILAVIIAAVAAATGVSVYLHSEMLGVQLAPVVAIQVAPGHQRGLFIVACYHLVAYATATVGGIGLVLWTVARRVAIPADRL